MSKNVEKFRQLVEDAKSILVTSHISPDPDAVCSLLLLSTTLAANFSDKKVVSVLEENPEGLNFLRGYDQIQFGNLSEKVNRLKPDLVIVVDAPTLQRCTRDDIEPLLSFIKANGIKYAIVDHHQPDDNQQFDVMINNNGPAATQEVYELCFKELDYKKPEKFAETTLTGIYSDTRGFIYKNTNPRKTFELVADLVDAGANLEQINKQLSAYSMDHMHVIAELIDNLNFYKDFTYTYISDDFLNKWVAQNKSQETLHVSCKMFADQYIRNIDNRVSGFLILKNPKIGPNGYSVSFRSIAGGLDVSKVAKILNGGGHIPAAGGKLEAKSLEQALEIVKHAIDQAY